MIKKKEIVQSFSTVLKEVNKHEKLNNTRKINFTSPLSTLATYAIFVSKSENNYFKS